MARIRTIKPEFFTSEDIVSLTPLARVFYVSLWCEADREGRLEWKPKTLKMRYLPGDNCDIDALCTELTGAGLVSLYEVDGKQYAVIPSFKKHQVINNREAQSVIPEPASSRVDDASLTRESGKEGKEGKGKEDASLRGAVALASPDDAMEGQGSRVGRLCKRIRQEGKFLGVQPADPTLLALLQAGYTDDEIFTVCQEAAQKGKTWGWAHVVIQARRADAAKVKAAPGAPPSDRAAMFRGAI